MTNLGFHRLMEDRGVRVLTTDVGDRYVLEALHREGGILGGEQSGGCAVGQPGRVAGCHAAARPERRSEAGKALELGVYLPARHVLALALRKQAENAAARVDQLEAAVQAGDAARAQAIFDDIRNNFARTAYAAQAGLSTAKLQVQKALPDEAHSR